MIYEQLLETVTKTIYLGQLITFGKKTEKEINRRITLAWKKYWTLKHIFKEPFTNDQKIEIFNSHILPVLTYESQTWTMTKN